MVKAANSFFEEQDGPADAYVFKTCFLGSTFNQISFHFYVINPVWILAQILNHSFAQSMVVWQQAGFNITKTPIIAETTGSTDSNVAPFTLSSLIHTCIFEPCTLIIRLDRQFP